MNFKVTTLFVFALFVGFACKKEGCTDPNATNYDEKAKKENGTCILPKNEGEVVEIDGVSYTKISGTINESITWSSSNNYLLSGGVFIESGATLTIESGTKIFAADDNTTPFLSIQRGGKIKAIGTASAPIVFTSIKNDPSPGEWGGIIVNGKAPINNGVEAQGEGGTGMYGGNQPNDNSGTLAYVRVEYAGKILGTDNELNGFSFNGVGSETTLHHLQAYKGSDDGFEFFGGTANLKYAVSTGNQDDSFDWTSGWSGKGQFWVAKQIGASDRGIEADNNSNNNTAAPFSNPILSNITLIGASDDGLNEGLRLRAGTKGLIYNILVTGFPKYGVRVSDQTTTNNMNNGDLVVDYAVLFGNGTNYNGATIYESNPNNTSETIAMTGIIGTGISSFDPTSLSSWFDAGTYKGAVNMSNDWTQGWVK